MHHKKIHTTQRRSFFLVGLFLCLSVGVSPFSHTTEIGTQTQLNTGVNQDIATYTISPDSRFVVMLDKNTLLLSSNKVSGGSVFTLSKPGTNVLSFRISPDSRYVV